MMERNSAARHWAVLIGVNFYPKVEGGVCSTEECLQGAVPDILAVQEYLENAPYPVDIVTLTATAPDDPTLRKPKEDFESWPTVDNVVQSLKRVIKKAKAGDYIYIHFSGHGVKRLSEGLSNKNLALVLFEDEPHYRSYLKGSDLRSCLRSMVRKGLLVTMVLDCCFSGSVLRNSQAVGTSIRAIEYDAAVDNDCPSDPWGSLFDLGNISRESELQHEWLVNPEGYTILAACGLDEKAFELQSSTGELRGGLTQFLLRALTELSRRNVQITQESLYNHICARLKAVWGAQTPRLYGKRGVSFFGELQNYSVTPLIPVFWRGDSPNSDGSVRRLYIRAGDAHGVSKGDVYDTYPLGTDARDSIRLRVDVVHSLHSEMVGFTSATRVNNIRDGWNAKLVRSEAEHKIAIRMTEEAYSYAKDSVEPDRLQFVRLHIGNENREACQFNVELNHSRQYCMYDGSMELLPHFEPFSIDTPNGDVHLLYILQRLASYKYLENLGIERMPRPSLQSREQTSTSFADSFTLEAFTHESEANRNGPGGPFHINHGDSWSLKVENHSKKEALYLAFFSFTSSWKIKDLTVPVGNNSFEEIRPATDTDRSQEAIRLTMKVPEGQTSCKDLIKVFLTNRPTLFPALNLDKDLMHHPRTRSARETVDSGIGRIPAFLTALSGLYRDTSGIEQKSIEHEAWSTKNYIIYTSLVN
ncbi:hypothetical protein EDB82DRAFT_2177 [Fusarium venenatum]|uniref:uncharacterized protein n=1 Tax=Fusarium venenatum TaxID=56646 RepID=UPI001D47F60A|nr:hypothetical protein EDB82DRAFT_2177 [Fusarium venenatum]